MSNDQPATIPVALAAVISTGVSLFSIVLRLDPLIQVAILAFGNSLIGLFTVLYLNRTTTSSSNPVVAQGTEVAMVGSNDTVIANPTPPGPEGVEDGAAG